MLGPVGSYVPVKSPRSAPVKVMSPVVGSRSYVPVPLLLVR